MSTITLRATKGSPLTNTEVDNNFSNLNTDKLEATYAGAMNSLTGGSSITTVSSTTGITTGAWKASAVGAAYGGTGVANNAANTITFTGAYSLGLTLTNTTSVTLPTTGTLATLAGSENLTNKTVNKLTITAPATGATLTIADGKTLTASNSLTFTGTDSSSVAFGAGGTVAYTNVTSLSSLATVGTITSGTWNGSVVGTAYGGTGVANGSNNTITFTGNYTLGLTLSGATSVTLPTSGTLATTTGTMAAGATWNGNAIGSTYGGTGLTSYTTGDIVYSSSGNTLSKLGVGSSGQVLTVSGGVPSWATPTVYATTGKAIAMAMVFGG